MADPTKKHLLSDIEIRQLEDMASKGSNMEDMAAILGISRKTLERRYKDQPGVAVAIRKGKAEANNKVGNKVLRRALGEDMTGDFQAMRYWLDRRAGWSDGSDDDGSSEEYDLLDSMKDD